MNIFLTILLALTTILSGAPANASAPVTGSDEGPTVFTGYVLKATSLWVPESISQAGIVLEDNVTFLYTNDNNCGAELSPVGMGGCTLTHANGSFTIILSPKLAYTATGNHILFHEIAHTMGASECEAEAFAHQFEYEPMWSYPECNTAA